MDAQSDDESELPPTIDWLSIYLETYPPRCCVGLLWFVGTYTVLAGTISFESPLWGFWRAWLSMTTALGAVVGVLVYIFPKLEGQAVSVVIGPGGTLELRNGSRRWARVSYTITVSGVAARQAVPVAADEEGEPLVKSAYPGVPSAAHGGAVAHLPEGEELTTEQIEELLAPPSEEETPFVGRRAILSRPEDAVPVALEAMGDAAPDKRSGELVIPGKGGTYRVPDLEDATAVQLECHWSTVWSKGSFSALFVRTDLESEWKRIDSPR